MYAKNLPNISWLGIKGRIRIPNDLKSDPQLCTNYQSTYIVYNPRHKLHSSCHRSLDA
jgi:hypothetical protein